MEKFALRIPDPDGRGTIKINPPDGMPAGGINALENILQVIIAVLFIFVIILCLFVLIYSGYLWMTSAGDKQKIAQVKQRMIYAVIGICVAFSVFLIINIISTFFGFKIIQ